MLLIKNLEEALKELDQIIKKHQGLARRERRIWNQLRLATEDLDTVRSKLTFHVTAINAFTSSLSRGTLVQIETVLLELVSEVRQGRRQPSLVSLHEDNNDSVWRELESELAGDGISSTDIVKHKAAIKVFVQGLLAGSNADTTSFVEVASLMESGNDEPDSESLSQSGPTVDLSPGDFAELRITGDAQNGSLASMDDEEYESNEAEYGSDDEEYKIADEEHEIADEELPPEDASVSKPTIRSRLTGPILNDALAYLDQIKVRFFHQPETYNQFLDIMESFKIQDLDTTSVIEWVYILFASQPQLLQDFNYFLPDGYRVECGTVDNCYAFRVIMPFTAYTRIPDLQALQLSTMGRGNLHSGYLKWIDPASLNILRPYSGIAAPFDWTKDQPASRVTEARKIFLSRFRAFLASLKATRQATSVIDRPDEINGAVQSRTRTGLAMSSRYASQPWQSSPAEC